MARNHAVRFCWRRTAGVSRLVLYLSPRQQADDEAVAGAAGDLAPVVPAALLGPRAKARTFYVHSESHTVHNVGDVPLVFSTKEQPQRGQAVTVQKILMTDDVTLSPSCVVEVYDWRWQIELFFKECKSTLGLHRYRFGSFVKVENGVQACLVTFTYLEWYRACQLHRLRARQTEQRWWQSQRCHGLALAAVAQAEEADLVQLYRWSATPAGRKRLRRCLREAQPREYRRTG